MGGFLVARIAQHHAVGIESVQVAFLSFVFGHSLDIVLWRLAVGNAPESGPLAASDGNSSRANAGNSVTRHGMVQVAHLVNRDVNAAYVAHHQVLVVIPPLVFWHQWLWVIDPRMGLVLVRLYGADGTQQATRKIIIALLDEERCCADLRGLVLM
jgi:hypothetical protein